MQFWLPPSQEGCHYSRIYGREPAIVLRTLEKYFDGILSMQRSEINRAIIPTIDEKLLIEKNVGKNSVTQTVIGK